MRSGMHPTRTQETLVCRHFDGDWALYEEYLSACKAQFLIDAQAGDAACTDLNGLPLLHRLAHSLKTVLQTLGYDVAAQQARDVELACALQDAMQARIHWTRVRHAILSV